MAAAAIDSIYDHRLCAPEIRPFDSGPLAPAAVTAGPAEVMPVWLRRLRSPSLHHQGLAPAILTNALDASASAYAVQKMQGTQGRRGAFGRDVIVDQDFPETLEHPLPDDAKTRGCAVPDLANGWVPQSRSRRW